MPFRKWAVEPVFLCRKPLPPDKDSCEFYAVTNVQLANCLRQLSAVAEIADRIFDEIGSECRLVVERAQRLKEKVSLVKDVVENLNARAVKVPVSDLTQTARLLRHQKPYETRYEKRTQLFLPSTRPPCVDRLYGSAAPTPVALICTIDKYRTDGLSSSDLFMVTPVLGGERKRKQKRYLDIETRKPANFSLARPKQDVEKFGSSSLPSVVSPSMGFILKQNENLELERLPSPEEQAMMMSLEYPSTVVPVDTSGRSFNKMSLLRRSLMHADFIIKRKKAKRKSKRRHTFCEGQNKEIEQAIRNVTNSSCQTDDLLDTTVSSSASINRSLSKRRSRSALDNSRRKTILDDLDLDSLQQESKDSATEDDKEKSPSKSSTINIKKSKTTSSLRSRSFNPISSLSAAISIAAVKMRNSTRGAGSKQDDGRSSSGNWSASSSTRASVDSDHQHTVSPTDGISSPSRNSVGKDSVLSDATQVDPHNRSRDEILLIQSLSNSPIKRKKFGALNLPWEPNHGNGRVSSTPTPDFTSQCSSSTPVIRSPYAGRRGISDDGDSSVYSVDTDGYYTSMHTDSGLWCNALTNMKLEEEIAEIPGFRQRQESQSSVSTIGNSSINSFLSKSATECSSNSGSLKKVGPAPPPRVSSTVSKKEANLEIANNDLEIEYSDKSDSPHPPNGSTSESEHEVVRDRIRVKTTITANRYPSMCAVSPETSDEEDSKKKLLPNLNVIVAEVHREDKPSDSTKKMDVPDSGNKIKHEGFRISQPSSSVNMYRSETPLPSNFSSSLCENSNPVATSTPRSGYRTGTTTFSPDLNKSRNNSSGSSCSRFRAIDSNFDSDEELTVTESPILSQTGSDKSLIPLKYAQRITVTPIARSDSSSSFTGTIKRTPLKSQNSNTNTVTPDEDKSLKIPYNKKDSSPSYISFQAPDSPVSSVSSFGRLPSSERISTSPTNSLPRSVARVTLDPTGKVLYSSNSLGRITYSSANRNKVEKTYATLPLCQTQTETKHIEPLKQISSSCKVDSAAINKTSEKNISSINQDTVSRSVTPTTQSPVYMRGQITPSASSAMQQDFSFRPSRGGRFCRSYFPSHLISPPPASEKSENSFPKATYSPACSENPRTSINLSNQKSSQNMAYNYSVPCSRQTPEYRSSYAAHNRSLNRPTTNVPNTVSDTAYSRLNSPVTSGVWPGRLYNTPPKNNCIPLNLKHQAINNKPPNLYSDIYAKKATPQTPVVSLRPPDLIPSGESPPSTLDITSPAGSQRKFHPSPLNPGQFRELSKDSVPASDQKSLKSMSASELFAIIHSSKKKHNIKTESEMSMSPMSSRSVSPAFSQSSLSKLQPIETGILSKRCEPSPSEKTKWCNSMPSNFRKQTDKLNTPKPTSMHDFKMLLLQTRTGVNDTSPRPSAAELLKVSPTRSSPVPQNNSSKSPVSSSFKSPVSHYSSNSLYSSGHGTVPLKRNIRTRSPYLTRYDSAYPPIMEDCSEEVESSYDDKQCLTSNPSFNQSPVYKMPDAVPRSNPVTRATSTWV